MYYFLVLSLNLPAHPFWFTSPNVHWTFDPD